MQYSANLRGICVSRFEVPYFRGMAQASPFSYNVYCTNFRSLPGIQKPSENCSKAPPWFSKIFANFVRNLFQSGKIWKPAPGNDGPSSILIHELDANFFDRMQFG